MAVQGMRNELIRCYRQYVGELRQVSEVDVLAGAGLSMAGLAVSIAGWTLYVYNETLTHGTAQFWTIRELSVGIAGLGVPVFMIGVIVLLLGNSRTTAFSLLGFVACLAAIVLFVTTYPDAWSVPGLDYSVAGVTLYGVGLLGLTFAAGAAFSCRVT
jgi:uncharacterized membrane protein